jgi:hypothetical protein
MTEYFRCSPRVSIRNAAGGEFPKGADQSPNDIYPDEVCVPYLLWVLIFEDHQLAS